uniref:Light-inducible protein CPRF2 n=1 Tax=Elaeis guineensis var. tenera TaxID=51953 RepID=A0A8N4F7B2_ELAGV|nr:light-inducible protein CPRF2 [Elaeis guineensis]
MEEARRRALGSFGGARRSPSSDRGGSSSTSGSSLPREQWGLDPIVEKELDAAQALAEMAIQQEQENKRIEDHGSPSTSREESIREGKGWGLKHEQLVDDYQEDGEAVKDAMEEKKSGQEISELPKADITCSTSRTPFSSRVKQNLAEAEKEAKRMRRILANRESARQTIRRRQIIREELTKKVADLSLKNKNMKMEKELVMKEYLSLKDTNNQLKEQISKAMNCEFGTSAEATSMQVEISASSSTNLPPMIYGKLPMVPYVWPPWLISTITRPCHEHDGASVFSGARPHLYLPPCAWFYPSSHEIPGSRSQHPHSPKERHEDPVAIWHDLGQSYGALDYEEKAMMHNSKETDLSLPHTIVTQEEENGATNNQRLLATVPTEHQMLRHCPYKLGHMSSHCRTLLSSSDVKGGPVTDHDDGTSLEKSGGACSHPNEQLLIAAAAAQARKRRRELIKLKQLHGRQAGLHS